MIFEEAYGRWLVSQIRDSMVCNWDTGLVFRQYSEVSFKPLAKNPDEIAFVISGGGAARSNVKGQDQNSGAFSVIAICQKKYMEHVQAAISSMQKTYNAESVEISYPVGLEDDISYETTVETKSVFFTPIVLEAQDYPTNEHGTLKIALIQFTATVLYGTTAVVSPGDYTLIIDRFLYDIKHVASYDNASIPSYDSYLAQGADRNSQIAIARNNSWAFTIYKTSNEISMLQPILENEAQGRGDGLWGKSLVLRPGGGDSEDNDIPIQTYQLTESYVDNAAVYILTLMA